MSPSMNGSGPAWRTSLPRLPTWTPTILIQIDMGQLREILKTAVQPGISCEGYRPESKLGSPNSLTLLLPQLLGHGLPHHRNDQLAIDSEDKHAVQKVGQNFRKFSGQISCHFSKF